MYVTNLSLASRNPCTVVYIMPSFHIGGPHMSVVSVGLSFLFWYANCGGTVFVHL